MLRSLLAATAVAAVGCFAAPTVAGADDDYFYGRRGRHADFHDDLDHREFHRELYHRDAHRYPMSWRQHDRLHDDLEHDAFHDDLEHSGYHRDSYRRSYRSSYRSGYGYGRSNFGFSISRGCGRGVSFWFGD